MTDFVTDLTNDIIDSMPDVSKDWAELNALITLSTFLSKAQIVERDKALRLNLIGVMVAPPGMKKSLPIFSFTYPIVIEAGKKIGRDFLLPSRSSVEGFIEYASMKSEDKKYINNEGIIIRDEFSGLFKQLRKADWQADGMEFISEMYDHNFQKRMTKTDGLVFFEDLYGSMITATTYHFITSMDPLFFIQGTGNRIIYCHMGANEYNPVKDTIEYFRKGWEGEREDCINKYVEKIEKVYGKINKNQNDPWWYIYVSEGELWLDYKFKCEEEWKKKSVDDPFGWSYHPIKRYAELALKLAGIYEISYQIDRIPKMDSNGFYNFGITKKSIKRGIDFIERCRKYFDEIVKIKNMNFEREKPKSQEDKAKAMLPWLANAPKGILPTNDWLDRQDVTTYQNEKYGLKRFCVARGWVKTLTFKELDAKTLKMFPGANGNMEFCQYVKGL